MRRSLTMGLVFLFAATSLMHADNPKGTFALVIHGGAGKAPTSAEAIRNRTEALNQCLDVGSSMLKEGKSSLDTVEAVVRILEDSPSFNAGKGAVFNAAGHHELDATIMNGRDRSVGAVGGVTTVKNPISLARRVMTDTKHIILVTDGAEKFADLYKSDPRIERVPNSYFSTDYRRKQLEEAQRDEKGKAPDGMGTVGCAALDTHGNLAAATSTGGLTNKRYGRIGDSPIPGAGTFADNQTCALSCTGIGEDFIRHVVAYDVHARMAHRNDSLEQAVRAILTDSARTIRGGIVAVDRTGTIVMQFNSEGMARAAADSKGYREVKFGK